MIFLTVMQRWKMAAAMIAAFLLAGSATARAGTSSIKQPRDAVGYIENADRANAAQVMVTFARCFARRRERAADAALRLPYFSDEQGAAVHLLIREYDSCLGNNEVALRFPVELLVGGMAEYFIVRRYEQVDISPLATMTDEAVAASSFAARNPYERLSLCIIRRDPATARALISTTPRTPPERLAFDRIAANLAPCVPADMQMTFSRSALRAMIAAEVFRILAALGEPR